MIELTKNQNEILNNAVKSYGDSSQISMVIEELTELSLSIQHLRRGKSNFFSIAEETADVIIMLKQLDIILTSKTTYSLKKLVETYIDKKIKKLKKNLTKEVKN